MSKHPIDERIHEIARRTAEKNGLEFVHIEAIGFGKNKTIRIFIDKPEGITHHDCSAVSSEVGELLDAEDFIEAAYLLEVSSPGLERELYSLRDFEKFTGSLAKVKTKTAINGQKHFRGRITKVEREEIFFDDKTQGEVGFPYSAVAKANLEIDIEEELKRNDKRKMEN
ncbi:MAG: ribosome maturation factor RimP [Actinomycetota bacterium]